MSSGADDSALAVGSADAGDHVTRRNGETFF